MEDNWMGIFFIVLTTISIIPFTFEVIKEKRRKK